MKKRVLIIVNENSLIGQGHIYRMLSLSETIYPYFNIIFFSNIENNHLLKKISKFSSTLIDYQSLNKISNFAKSDDYLVIDDYNISIDFLQKIRCKVKKIFFIDDFGKKYKNCDVIINHSIEKDKKVNSKKYFYGFDYLLIRKKFKSLICTKEKISNKKTILICIGASDPYGYTDKIIRFIINSKLYDTINLISGSNTVINTIKENFRGFKINYYLNLNEKEIIKIVSKSDLAITTASTIALELCTLHIPLVCGVVHQNQKLLHNSLIYTNCILSLGDFKNLKENNFFTILKSTLNKKTINQLLKNQVKYFDGKSSERILKLFINE